ncbi:MULTISPECIES: RodZ domain-containing protein [Burkholderia]|uniref:RodZ domain-containing protein n=1 Tax=Burkholderia TaxID=32008 RepID=UPI0007566DB7|nr:MULTISPECIES: RodZ domain-containing protein [Burkholderia]AOJ68735.1 XRE family transcriptional regulator [Burkholderia savannae]KVG49947.1 XRE family transcriptional regulator [Burkholderia sp. MSMB0265]KVG83675.1 XRE family transcriptional regulator [Burkholderia sp. MSMB2040]KVG94475.1 XRE family transcriptional regulator [Burkholderia sp. MSMB2041]KVG95415.1 XRE family transcriptional regulator [Burkholderia sp. MSMB2042]
MSEPQPSKSPETNAGEKPAAAGGGIASVAAVGARLAELREAKGWSVDDVSARLKVAASKLQALEAGDTSQLPGTTFALGLVRSYAKMLGVDPEPFAQALRREKGVPEVDLSMPASAGTDLPRGRVSIPLGGSSRGRPWLWAVAAVVVALIAAAMWRTGGESSNWLARFKSSGAGEAASGARAQQPEGAASDLPASAAVSGTVTQASAVAASATQSGGGASAGDAVVASVPTAGSAPAVESAVAVPPASTPVAAAQPAQSMQQSAALGADGASAVVTAAPGQSVVALKVAQDCWFSVRDKNGKELFSSLVRAGETKQVAGDAPLKVTIGNKAGLESIAFDGKPVDPAKYSTARGNVARFALP